MLCILSTKIIVYETGMLHSVYKILRKPFGSLVRDEHRCLVCMDASFVKMTVVTGLSIYNKVEQTTHCLSL